jgi:hypothetical protein
MGGGYRGGGSSGGSWQGGQGGSWHGGQGGNWNGGWHGGGGWRGGYGYRGYYGWRGGYWGPGFGVYWGGPLWWGAWPYASYAYGYPYGYGYGGYPAYNMVVDSPTYISEEPASGSFQSAQPAPANNFWYYCADPAGYYPYVKNCNQTWMQVVPQNNPGTPRLAP